MKGFVGKHFLLIVENASVPFDKRVWREALALKDEGANISMISPVSGVDNKKYEKIEGIDIFRYKLRFSSGSRFSFVLEYFSAFLSAIILFHKILVKKGKIHVVHVANPPDIFWPLAIYCNMHNIKFIFDEHDLTPETYLSRFEVEEKHGGTLFKILRSFQYLSYKYAHAVISTNETYKQRAIAKYPPNEKKIFIVRNGPDTRKFFLVPADLKLKKGKSYLFAYIGIMAIQDGVDYIVNSINYLVNTLNFKDFIVYLIGSGDDVPRLKNMVEENKLEDFIIFTGRIPDEPAIEILSTADICLSPDPFNPLNDSSTMNKVMEYMALGKPIVSFDLKEAKYSAREAAIYVKNNDIAAFAEGILTLLKDPLLSSQMGEAGKKRINEKLCWQRQTNNLINTYRFVLKMKKEDLELNPQESTEKYLV